MRIFNKGFNFSQDGPGNRLVYHLQGCNMHCIWCSNPEGMCREGGREYSVSELFDECRRSRAMFFSGGGVTFTGGEATLWHDELLELLRLLRSEGISTAIETNGTSARLPELLPHIDCLMMDFKLLDSDRHKKYTGIGNGRIKENLEYLCREDIEAHIRIPLINGINTAEAVAMAEYFSSQNTEKLDFEFLRYHEFGKNKWKEEYKVKGGFVTLETVKEFTDTFKRHGLRVITT